MHHWRTRVSIRQDKAAAFSYKLKPQSQEYLHNVGLVLAESLETTGMLIGFGRAAPLASHLLGGLC